MKICWGWNEKRMSGKNFRYKKSKYFLEILIECLNSGIDFGHKS